MGRASTPKFGSRRLHSGRGLCGQSVNLEAPPLRVFWGRAIALWEPGFGLCGRRALGEALLRWSIGQRRSRVARDRLAGADGTGEIRLGSVAGAGARKGTPSARAWCSAGCMGDPVRRVTLLARHVRIRVRLQDRVDDAGEPVQLRPPHRLRPAVARRRRVAQHLLHRATVDAEPTARLVMAQPLVDNRQSNRRIELHAVHLLPLVATDKGP